LRLYLLTMVRKSELLDATWDEVDFENAVWTIPKERMKRSKALNVYFSRQVLDIFIALKTCAGNSKYVPSRYDADAPMSRAPRRSVLAQEGRWRLVHPEGRNRCRGRSRAGRAT